MSDSVARGKRLQRRRIGLGINSVNEFCKRTGVSRNAITGAERGNASESTFVRLEAWLDQHGAPPLTDEQQRVEIGATVDHNGHRITITAAGPPGDRRRARPSRHWRGQPSPQPRLRRGAPLLLPSPEFGTSRKTGKHRRP